MKQDVCPLDAFIPGCSRARLPLCVHAAAGSPGPRAMRVLSGHYLCMFWSSVQLMGSMICLLHHARGLCPSARDSIARHDDAIYP